MTPQRHRQISEIFQQIAELPDEERATRIDQLCGADGELRREVISLLAHHHEHADAFDERHVGAWRKLVDPPPTQLPARIGPFRILRRIGEGGMGMVFEAEQEHPNRRVALKVIRSGIASDSTIRRFRHEAELLGRLQHPGIADVYEAGFAATPVGQQPYFAMQLIDGHPFLEYARRHDLDIRARLGLFARVCDAIQYAHQRGIIHRDLKPGNILVDAAGQPKILDFGVARVVDSDLSMATMQTATGQVIGTLPYMSPEQVSGRAADVDTRSDVYSLGVSLYELLAGRLPFETTNCTLPEAARLIADVEPAHLSRIDRRLRGDVETIVRKALQKERSQRYQSVAEFAADIRRYLADEPVLARPPSAMYQIRKFARRNTGLVVGVLGIFASLVLGLAGVSWFWAGELRQRKTAETASGEARRLAYRVSVSAAADAIGEHNLSAARRLLNESPAELRGWEWRHLSTELDDSFLQIQGKPPPGGWIQERADGNLIQHTLQSAVLIDLTARRIVMTIDSAVPAIAVSPDGTRATAVSGSTRIELHDLDRDRIASLPDMPSAVRSLGFSDDGLLLAAGGEQRELRLYDLQTHTVAWEKTLPRSALGLSFSPDVRWLATREAPGLLILDLRDGRVAHDIAAPGFVRFTASLWSSDGSLIFNREAHPESGRHFLAPIRIADGTRLPHWSDHDRELVSFLIAPDHASALTCHAGGLIRLHDLPGGAIRREFTVEGGSAFAPVFSPDGQWLAYGELNGLIQLDDRTTGRRLATLRGQDSPSGALLFSRDGKSLYSTALDGMIRAWDISNTGEEDLLRGHTSFVYPVAFSPDGTSLASGSWDQTIRLWSIAQRREQSVLRGHAGQVTSLAFSPDGRRLLSRSMREDEDLVWELKSGVHTRLPEHSSATQDHPAFFTDGGRIWLPGPVGETERVWNIESGSLEMVPLTALRELRDGRVSPRGDWIARSLGVKGTLTLVNLDDPTRTQTLGDSVANSAFDADGRRVVFVTYPPSPSTGEAITLWDVDSGKRLRALSGHIGDVFDAKFSPDSRRLATCGRDGTICIWDSDQFDQLVRLRGHQDYVWSIAWSPDGGILASGSGDTSVRLWRSGPTGSGLLAIEGHGH